MLCNLLQRGFDEVTSTDLTLHDWGYPKEGGNNRDDGEKGFVPHVNFVHLMLLLGFLELF